jgi:hypothetical protein
MLTGDGIKSLYSLFITSPPTVRGYVRKAKNKHDSRDNRLKDECMRALERVFSPNSNPQPGDYLVLY